MFVQKFGHHRIAEGHFIHLLTKRAPVAVKLDKDIFILFLGNFHPVFIAVPVKLGNIVQLGRVGLRSPKSRPTDREGNTTNMDNLKVFIIKKASFIKLKMSVCQLPTARPR